MEPRAFVTTFGTTVLPTRPCGDSDQTSVEIEWAGTALAEMYALDKGIDTPEFRLRVATTVSASTMTASPSFVSATAAMPTTERCR